MNMSIQPGLGVRRRVGSDVTGVTVRQVKGEEVRFLFNPADHDQGFAEIGLAHDPLDVLSGTNISREPRFLLRT